MVRNFPKHLTSRAARAGDCRLSLERLEPRLALDSTGVLLGADAHLTLSFAPDGTPVADLPSALDATMTALAPAAQWQEAILRAFQTWAIHTNADIGLVADGGQPFGVPGANHLDDRFGDIRIGTSPLSPEVGAVSVPIDNLASGSWLADVIFNSQFDYQTLDDLLAVATHEAGNVFGLEDSLDPASPLFSHTSPQVLLPTATDIVNLQALHGVRAADFNEVHGGDGGPERPDNDSFANATRLRLVDAYGLDEGSGPSIVYGDIRDLADDDYFVIPTPSYYTGPMTVRLATRGISLLEPELTIFNSAEAQLAQSSSQVVGGAVLTMQIPSIAAGEDYFLRVSGAATDVFGIGGYSLTVTFDAINVVDQTLIEELAGGAYRLLSAKELAKFFDADEDDLLNDDEHTDDAAELGTDLDTTVGFAEGTRYEIYGSIADSTDVDHYVFKSPQAAIGIFTAASIIVESLDAGQLMPKIDVLDEDGLVIPSDVIVNGSGTVLVQIDNVTADTDYVVRVGAEDPQGLFSTGNYKLTIVLAEQASVLETMAAGVLGGEVQTTEHTLYVGRPQLFHFVLDAGAATVAVPTGVLVTIRDAQGGAVATLVAPVGGTRSAPAVLLNPGTYTADFRVLTFDGLSAPPIAYELRGLALSDPFVGDPTDPTGNPFTCEEDPDFFCYPGLPDPSPDPFLWDDFIDSLNTPPPAMPFRELIDLLLGSWWSWYWDQTGTNGPPLALDDNFRVAINAGSAASDGSPVMPSVLANDIEPENNAMVALLDSSVTHGTLNLHADGTFEYTPAAGFFGTDQFTYIAYDFVNQSVPGTVTFVVQLPGDFDNSGTVDAADQSVWRANFGSSNLVADGNGDGVVNIADYTLWRDNLGATVPVIAAFATAEPTSAAVAVAEDVDPQIAPGPALAYVLPKSTQFVASPQHRPLDVSTAEDSRGLVQHERQSLLLSGTLARPPRAGRSPSLRAAEEAFAQWQHSASFCTHGHEWDLLSSDRMSTWRR